MFRDRKYLVRGVEGKGGKYLAPGGGGKGGNYLAVEKKKNREGK